MVAVYTEAPISVLTDLQDFLLNQGGEYAGVWDVEVKLYRANPASFGPEDKQRTLFTVWSSVHPELVWILLREHGYPLTLPIKQILDTKLPSLWTQRQVFRGSGHVYTFSSAFAVRITNIFVQGSYKGLLIDIDPNEVEAKNLAEQLNTLFSVPLPQWDRQGEAAAREYLQIYR